METGCLQRIQGGCGDNLRVPLCQGVDDGAEHLLVNDLVYERVIHRQGLVQNGAPEGSLQHDGIPVLPAFRSLPIDRRDNVLKADASLGIQIQFAQIEGHDGFGYRGEVTHNRVAVLVLLYLDCRVGLRGQVEQADDHILRRHGNRTAVRRLQDVVCGQHQDAGFSLRLSTQRQVDCHLVTVEVGVERTTYQRVQLNSLTFNQYRFERLNA